MGAEMKYLVSILAIGLLLPSAMSQHSFRLSDRYDKLCGREFIRTLLDICQAGDIPARRSSIPDPYLTFDENAGIMDMDKVKVQRMLNNAGTEQFALDNGQEVFNNDNNLIGQKPGGLSGFVSETQRDNEIPDGGQKTRRGLAADCCAYGCTVEQISRAC